MTQIAFGGPAKQMETQKIFSFMLIMHRLATFANLLKKYEGMNCFGPPYTFFLRLCCSEHLHLFLLTQFSDFGLPESMSIYFLIRQLHAILFCGLFCVKVKI